MSAGMSRAKLISCGEYPDKLRSMIWFELLRFPNPEVLCCSGEALFSSSTPNLARAVTTSLSVIWRTWLMTAGVKPCLCILAMYFFTSSEGEAVGVFIYRNY
jgi:hypothetical protein